MAKYDPSDGNLIEESESDVNISVDENEISDTVKPTIGYRAELSQVIDSCESVPAGSNSITPGQGCSSSDSYIQTLPNISNVSNFQIVEHSGNHSDDIFEMSDEEIPLAASVTPSLIPGTDSSFIAALNENLSNSEINNSNNNQNLILEPNSMSETKKRKISSSPENSQMQSDTPLSGSAVINDVSVSKKLCPAPGTGHDMPSQKKVPQITDLSKFWSADREQSRTVNDNNVIENPVEPIDSFPKKQIILMEPVADHRVKSKFLSNEIAIARGLAASAFGKYNIIDTHKNIAKSLLIVQVELPNEEALKQLLAVKIIGDWNVKCKLPMAQRVTYGVIGPVGIETSDEDILEAIQKNYTEVSDAKRITKGNDKTKTLSIKLAFNGTCLPDKVCFMYQSFEVKQYVDRPWQCFKCQGFGHNAPECRFKARCLLCAGNHQRKNCPKNGKPINVTCTNCGGEHLACYGGCPYMKTAKKVEHVRATKRLSYRDAVKAIKESIQVKQNPVNPDPISTQGENNSTQSHPQNPGPSQAEVLPRVQCFSIATQTEPIEFKVKQVSDDKPPPSLLAQMAIMVVEILKIGRTSPEKMNYSTALDIAKRMNEAKSAHETEETQNPIAMSEEQPDGSGDSNEVAENSYVTTEPPEPSNLGKTAAVKTKEGNCYHPATGPFSQGGSPKRTEKKGAHANTQPSASNQSGRSKNTDSKGPLASFQLSSQTGYPKKTRKKYITPSISQRVLRGQVENLEKSKFKNK